MQKVVGTYTFGSQSKEVRTMYTLQVMCQRRWRWGIVQYDTLEAAKQRVQELARVGIKSRIKLTAELYGR